MLNRMYEGVKWGLWGVNVAATKYGDKQGWNILPSRQNEQSVGRNQSLGVIHNYNYFIKEWMFYILWQLLGDTTFFYMCLFWFHFPPTITHMRTVSDSVNKEWDHLYLKDLGWRSWLMTRLLTLPLTSWQNCIWNSWAMRWHFFKVFFIRLYASRINTMQPSYM